MGMPDTSDVLEMARVGRLYTLRSARRKAAQKLRDKLVPVLNNIEAERGAWDLSGIAELLSEIEQLTALIDAA
jgi:hypothetical protein